MKSIFLNIFLFLITCSFYANTSENKIDTLHLENEFLSIKISTYGAELIRIFNKKENFEHLWQGEKTSWNQHSPILFPIVGKLKKGGYTFEGVSYKMKNHGFASRQEFKVIHQSRTKVILELIENEETLKQYPFKFRLLAIYTLKGNKLSVSNVVRNTNNKGMYFSIGAHPGFNIPFSPDENYDAYYLEFEQNEIVNRLPLTKEKGLLSNIKIENYLNNSDKLRLNHPLFKDRAVILEGLQSKTVTIKSDHSKMKITIGIEGFPFVGVWSSSKKDAPFICIEPWYGISDFDAANGDLKTKKGIQLLKQDATFTMSYFIQINNVK